MESASFSANRGSVLSSIKNFGYCPNRTYAPAVPTARGRRSRLLGNSTLTWQKRVIPLINGTMAVVNDGGSRLREQVVTKRLQSGDVRASMETDLKSMANIKLCGWVRNAHTLPSKSHGHLLYIGAGSCTLAASLSFPIVVEFQPPERRLAIVGHVRPVPISPRPPSRPRPRPGRYLACRRSYLAAVSSQPRVQ